MGPLAGRKAVRLLEAGQPVLGVRLADDEKRPGLLADGEPAL
jgi:hypothetical protein